MRFYRSLFARTGRTPSPAQNPGLIGKRPVGLFDASPYYDKRNWTMSESMRRARAPFFWKNIFVGGILTSIVAGIYLYSIKVSKPDDLSDIPIPPLDEETIKRLKEEEAAGMFDKSKKN